MKLNKISADMVSRRPDQTAEWLNRLARQVDIVEANLGSASKKPGDLPIATTYSLGVVKIGQNLSITPEGVLSALAPTSYNYELLFNKPKINNVELIGNKSLSDLGIDIPTKTSELLNDGSDGTSTYVELDELAAVATSGAYADLSGTPTNLSDFNNDVGYITSADLPTKTSDLQNDGADGTSTYVEADDLATVATSGSYTDLINKPTIGNATLTIQKNSANVGTFTANATSNQTIDISVPTQTSDIVNNGADGTSTYVEADELATVATSGSYADLLNKPTIGNATLTIQKNGTSAGTFTANATSNKTINITVPTTAADVGALPDTTKYAASLSLTINSSTYVVTGQLKDQDGNNLGTAQTIDLPLESVVVSGSYDSATKEVVLVLENGSEIRFSVADLVSGLQSEITSANPLDADLVDDSNSTNKFVTSSDITTWNGKQDALTAGSNIQINGTTISATDTTYSAGSGISLNGTIFSADTSVVQEKLTAGSNIQINGATISATDTTYTAGTGLNLNGTQFSVDTTTIATQSDLPTKTSDLVNDGSDNTSVYVEADELATVATSGSYSDLSNKPTIGNATLTIQQNGTAVQTFTANATSNKTANITVPTKTSDITNDGADGTSTYVENDDLTTALSGKQDTLTAGTNINIASNTISTQTRGIEYIVGTQASTTNLWTGVSTDDGCSSGTLYTGKTIVYHLPVAGNSSAATLNLTLPDGTTTGAKNVKYNTGGNVTTTYGAGCDIFMVYDGTYWKASAWYDSNNYDRIRYNNSVKAAAAISSGGRVCVGTDAGYVMAAANATFDITYPILYSGSAVNSGATNTNFYGAINGVNLSSTKSGWSGAQYKMTFLVGTLSGTTFTIGSDVFTQTVPTSEDGKIYSPLGIAYSTTNILFYPDNTYWAYKNGAFRPISHSEPVMTGASSGTAGASGLVPAPAAGDDTKFLSGDGLWKTVSQYSLPIATANDLGGIKVGSRLTINSTTGVLSADSQTDNNFTTTLKNKLDGIASGAEVNVQSDWTEADNTSDAYIQNKPNLATVATSGSYNDLTNKPTIPAAQVNSDWNANSGVAQILNKPSLATVATSGSYNDLSNKPTIPTVNNATLTIQKNGTNVQTFTANQSTNATANITVPTKTSDITNDSGFITSSGTVAKADQLTTPRTIAIGTGATGTATSFNGTSNITIPVTDVKDSYVTWGGKIITQNVSPDDAGCIDEFGHNKLAFLPANCIDVAYSTDGGTTWSDYGLTDAQKIAMVTTTGTAVYVGGPTDNATSSNIAGLRARVRIAVGPTTGGKIYTAAKKILINFSNQGAGGSKVTIRNRTIGNYKDGIDTWTTVGTYDIAGGSGWNSYPYNTTFGGSFSTQTSQIGQVEFVLSCTSLGTWGYKKPDFIDFRMIGMTNWTMPSEMARAGHIYTFDTYQNTFFPNGVLPKTDNAYSLGASSYRWKNLYLSGSIYHGSTQLSLPSTAGTLALTSDIPTVNNATLTIQKNSTNVATFTANASSNVTANISVPTKTSELTNDSGFVTDTSSQSFAAQEGSTNPVFDDMTPLKTFTWTVADTTYRPVYQMDNTGWAYDNMDITVAYRITVTGSSISQVTDVIDRWFAPTSWPVTSVMCRTLSNSAATTGYRYLRAVYPTSSGLNNNTYKIGQEISNYNATSRTIKVEVFKTATGITWNETKPAGTIYTSSTYQATNAMQPYGTRGWLFRAPASFNATSADAATRVSNYESATINSSAIKSGAALTAGYIGFQATDGKVYMITNTTANMACDENARIGYITNAYNANTAIDTRYLRSVTNIGSTQVGYIPHATMALGDRLYLRCTMDSSGNIHSDNYLATSMTAGYTWLPFGTATASNTIYMDVRKPTFYTLDASGRLVRVNGQPTGIEQAAFVGNTLSPAPGVFVYTSNLADGSVTADKISKPSLLDFFYPVGSYYETSDTSFNPNTAWGGTWVEDTAGKVLVAKDSGTFATVGDTGGLEETTITNDNIPQGLISVSHVAAMESEFYSGGIVTKGRGNGLQREGSSTTLSTTTYSHTYTFGKSTPDAMTNLQPYTVIKRWHRTA